MTSAYNYEKVVINNLKSIDITKTKDTYYNYKELHFLAKIKENAENLVILFHGAVSGIGTDRVIFRGYLFKLDKTNIICLCDGLLQKYKDFNVNWFFSTDKYKFEKDYHDVIDYFIKSKKYNKVIFSGTSSGGLPSIHFASIFKKTALIANSQLYPDIFGSAVKLSDFYQLTNMIEKEGDKLAYKKRSVEEDVLKSNPEKIIIYNNTLDYTYKNHAKTFIQFLEDNKLEHLLDLYLFKGGKPPAGKDQHNVQFPDDMKHVKVLEKHLKEN